MSIADAKSDLQESKMDIDSESAKFKYSSLMHWIAWLTPLCAMLTIVMGALTTTKDAGMAFRDWPTSDGQGMLTYPWFSLFDDMMTNRDSFLKFLEHGHRLAGMLIGFVSIILVGVAYATHQRPFVTRLSVGILLAVILQGLLGGFRVELDRRGLAMVHGLTASLVFSMMVILVMVTSKPWLRFLNRESVDAPQPGFQNKQIGKLRTAKWFSHGLTAYLLVQYGLGGMIRHHGLAIHEHLGFGLLAIVWAFVLLAVVLRTKNAGLGVLGSVCCAMLLAQIGLGLATYVVKFGYGPVGYVAVADSIGQVALRTVHMVFGVLVVSLLCTLSYKSSSRLTELKSKSEHRADGDPTEKPIRVEMLNSPLVASVS